MTEKPMQDHEGDRRDRDRGDGGPGAEPGEAEGPPEIVAAALQELEYPADETDEG